MNDPYVRTLLTTAVLAWLATGPTVADTSEGLPRIADKTADLEQRMGLLPLWLDAEAGRVWLELPPPGERGVLARLLYIEGLAAGLGSNPVGLDRGQLGASVVIELRRVGGKVLFEQPNLGFRAGGSNPHEVRAVRQSFASSVLWATPVAAQDDDGSTLIDLTPFLVRDAHGSARTLASAGQGTFQLDEDRSSVDIEAILTFPENLEFEAILTFSGSEPGGRVREVVPTPESITLVQHHSLVALPDPGYKPRLFDPRAGSFAISFQDYAAPLDAPLTQRWIVRHRLEKTDPRKSRSRVKEPIVYYVDRATPEPVRRALVDGASWWADAFDDAGFIDAFRIELLPDNAHPLDVRYNVIQWVHRSTRGWSYGGGVTDPRTGEMIKGHVSLGSLRVRQDRLLFEGLLGTGETGTGTPEDPVQLALARIRQLSAHEVGHTLGLTHNFAASTYGRASVMDYPAPLVRLNGGRLDVSEAYAVGVGAWDRHAIRWAYSEFAPTQDEAFELDRIVREGIDAGLLFLTDHDARPAGAAHPLANLWDNGADPVAELRRVLAVRRHALDRFGERNVVPGTPLALLEEVLATVYLHHRYQLDATIKLIGGVDYRYAIAGDGQPPPRFVPLGVQRKALIVVMSVLTPENLDIPEAVLLQLPPRPFGYGRNRELFEGATAPLFDPLGAAATAAGQVVAGLLQPQRCARLVDQQRRDPNAMGLDEMLAQLVTLIRVNAKGSPRHVAITRVVQRVILDGMLELLDDPAATSAVRAHVRRALTDWLAVFNRIAPHDEYLVHYLRKALDRPLPARETGGEAPPPPPGSPIGAERGCGWAWADQARP